MNQPFPIAVIPLRRKKLEDFQNKTSPIGDPMFFENFGSLD